MSLEPGQRTYSRHLLSLHRQRIPCVPWASLTPSERRAWADTEQGGDTDKTIALALALDLCTILEHRRTPDETEVARVREALERALGVCPEPPQPPKEAA